MALNPLRETLGPRGLRVAETGSAFKPEAEAALARFRARSDELQRSVRRGELTTKVARRLAAEAAEEIKRNLGERSEGFSTAPRAFIDRLAEATTARERSRTNSSLEALQRETNRLLRDSLIEQQIRNREDEFRAQTFLRPVAGGEPAPTLDSLVRFHEVATLAGDEAAREWARRRLEAFRELAPEPEDQRRIDLACDRPDRVNPRLVSRYVEQLDGAGTDELERFAQSAIEARDASACVAAFVAARQAPDGASLSWVRQVLKGVDQFPDSALSTLRAWEAEAREEELDAVRGEIERVSLMIEAEAALPALKPPTSAELERAARVESLPPIAPGEPIGLTLTRRGLSPEEFAAIHEAPVDSSPSDEGGPDA